MHYVYTPFHARTAGSHAVMCITYIWKTVPNMRECVPLAGLSWLLQTTRMQPKNDSTWAVSPSW